ncbi:lipopolysaccharide biosynthesis protein [Neorhizobium petrolearium]|uniref:lipopolysaccharide biosynthesis protein n=1 Tax=Neorhizobium petrolearium TaxID=515361 RepID=UPI003F166398
MTIVANIFRSSVANAIGIGISAFVQLVSVPVLASAWGPEVYGTWLMLTTIPTYLALTDLGFVQAATSDMTMKSAKGEKPAIVQIFSSVFALFIAFAVIVNVVVAAAVRIAVLADVGWVTDYQLYLHMLAFYSSLTLLSRVNLAGFRANGMYAAGTVSYDTLVLCEGLLTLLVVTLHGGFAAAISTMIVGRLLNMLLLYALLRRRLPWLSYDMEAVSRAELKRLFKPAVGGMAIPVSLSFTLQGTVVLVGAVISPAAAAIFTPVRTISRIAIQLVGIVNRATMPEIAHTLAKGDKRKISQLVLLNCALAVSVLVPAGIVFGFFGDRIVSAWTRGIIQPDRIFVAAMAVSMVLHGGWYLVSNMLLATNSHGDFSKIMILSAPLTVVLVYIGASVGELPGVALATIACEAFCVAGALFALRRTPFNPAYERMASKKDNLGR